MNPYLKKTMGAASALFRVKMLPGDPGGDPRGDPQGDPPGELARFKEFHFCHFGLGGRGLSGSNLARNPGWVLGEPQTSASTRIPRPVGT